MGNKPEIFADGAEESFAEKRQSNRKKLIVDVHFEGGDATGIANTENISTGGLYMRTNTPFKKGQSLLLRLTIGGGELVLAGRVAFVEEGLGVGVRFQDLSNENEMLLRRELAEE